MVPDQIKPVNGIREINKYNLQIFNTYIFGLGKQFWTDMGFLSSVNSI